MFIKYCDIRYLVDKYTKNKTNTISGESHEGSNNLDSLLSNVYICVSAYSFANVSWNLFLLADWRSDKRICGIFECGF